MYLHTQAWLFTGRKRNCTENWVCFFFLYKKDRDRDRERERERFTNHTVKFPNEQAISKKKNIQRRERILGIMLVITLFRTAPTPLKIHEQSPYNMISENKNCLLQ